MGRGTVSDPVLYRLPGLSPMLRSLYDAAGDMARVAELPSDAATPATPAPVEAAIDLRDYAFDPAFHGVAMIDFFLGRLGIDAGTVPSAARRNTWLAPRLPHLPAWDRAGPVLLCPNASMPLRDMPDPVRDAMMRHLGGRGVAVTVEAHEPDIEALAAGVRRSCVVISTDTAMVHLADAMAVPCIAFFPTHDPALRVRDYPLCRPVRLPADLPPGLEFARDERDVAAARAAWFRPGLDWIGPVLDAALLPTGVP